MDLHGLRGGRGLSGPDRPDRLIGDRDVEDVLLGKPVETFLELSGYQDVRTAALPLRKRLSQTEDRPEPVSHRGTDLPVHFFVALAESSPPLGMPKNHVAASEILHHGRRDL